MCIAGAGWAGLAAAVELVRSGVPVQLFEAARQPGGRARSLYSGGFEIDNGQHLMTGAFDHMLALMQQLGVPLSSAFYRIPLSLRLRDTQGDLLNLRAVKLPAPLNLLAALVTARGLTLTERLAVLRLAYHLRGLRIDASRDISVENLLQQCAQGPALVTRLWEPLCVAALNLPVTQASARVFLRVLRESFLASAHCSDMLIPRQPLSDLLPQPALEFLRHQGAGIHLGERVRGISLDDDRVAGIQTAKRSLPASHVILATPHRITQRILAQHPRLSRLSSQLQQLDDEPVTTLYLRYPPATRLQQPLLGFIGGLSQWIFDRRYCGQPGVMAIVISTHGEHMQLSREDLTERICNELGNYFPHWPQPLDSLVIREKRATFCCHTGIDSRRPVHATAAAGLWLAGDYTANGLPATVEAAVRSGRQCARELLHSMR